MIDDRPFSRRLLNGTLRLLSFRHVLNATDADEVSRILSSQPVDIILLEWHLSSAAAAGIMTMIRNADDPRVAALPVLVVAGKADRKLVATVSGLQADGMVTKPFSATILDQGIHMAIRRRRGRNGQTRNANSPDMSNKSQRAHL